MNINWNDIHQSKTVRGIIIGIAIAIIVLAVFQMGVVVGYHKARFANKFDQGFERNFMGSSRMNFRNRIDGGLPPAGHGAAGSVVSINLPKFVVADQDHLEKTIVTSSSTLVRKFRSDGAIADIKEGDVVVVLGNPNDQGEIEAKVIRIMPSPMMIGTPTVTSSVNKK